MTREPTDAMLDDLLYRREVIEEERQNWEDEMADQADDFNDDCGSE